jgi:hypothetical protein
VTRPHLRAVVDGETGEIHTGCARCEDVAVGDLDNAERRIRKLEREKRAMERDRDAERQADPQRQEIMRLIDMWRRVTGHPRANINAGDRFDVVKARLAEGYSVEQVELAIEGIGAFRYVVEGQRMRHGSPGQRHDRLGIACGSGENLERMANLGHQARKERVRRNEQ